MNPEISLRVKPEAPEFDFRKWMEKASRSQCDKTELAFLQKFEELSRGGLPPGDALKIMVQRLREPRLNGISQHCWRDLREGKSVSQSLRGLPKLFDGPTLSILEVGEATGSLRGVLPSACKLVADRIRVRENFISGLSYPVLLLSMATGVFLFGILYIMPMVEAMMTNMGGELSIMVQILLFVGNYSVKFGPFVLLGAFIGGVLFYRWIQTDQGRWKYHTFLLTVPVIRDITQDAEICRFANLAGILMRNGVETTEALRLMERSLSNVVLRRRLHQARQMIKDGVSFSHSLSRSGLLPSIETDILSIGENVGNLAEGFEHIYVEREKRLKAGLDRLTKMVAYGALGGIFVAIFMLVFGLVGSILQLNQQILSR